VILFHTMGESVGKSWDLSLYELHRTPQEAVTDNTEISVSPKVLQSELTCPICLEMLTSTMTTKECLHRFCAECITTALRSGNKECPTCRKKLVSRRSLRPDPNFDSLLAKIFPDREEYEEQQEKALAILSRNHSAQLMSSIGDAIKAQAAHVRQMNKKKGSDYDTLLASHCQLGDGTNPELGMDDSDLHTVTYRPRKKRDPGLSVAQGEIEIVIKPHAEVNEEVLIKLGDTKNRFVKTIVTASIEHIAKYLSTRIESEINSTKDDDEDKKLEIISNMKIFVLSNEVPGEYIELTGPETLEMVVEDYWKVPRPLELHYKCDNNVIE